MPQILNFLNQYATSALLGVLVIFGLFTQAAEPDLYFVVAISIFVLMLVAVKQRVNLNSVQMIFVLLMVISATIIPIFFSHMPSQSLTLSFAFLLGLAGFFLIDKKRANILMWCLVFVSVLDAFYGFYQLIEGDMRPLGIYLDWQLRALYSWISLLFLYDKLSREPSTQKVVLGFTVIAILFFSIHTTQSRTMEALVFLAVLVFSVQMLWSDRKRRIEFLILVSLWLLTYLLYYFLMKSGGSFVVRGFEDVAHLNSRVPQFQAAWEFIKQKPILGHGFGLWMFMYPSVRTEYVSIGFNVHNDFIEYWATTGIVGVLPLLLIFIYFINRFIKSFIGKDYRAVVFSGLLVSMMVYANLNFYFWRVENFIILAVIWRLMDHERDDFNFQVTLVQKAIVGLVFLIPVVVLTAKLVEVNEIKKNPWMNDSEYSWTDKVLKQDSMLVPLRARYLASNIERYGVTSEIQPVVEKTILQLDSAINAGTRWPTYYCARAELGAQLGEAYDDILKLVKQGSSNNPSDVYCQIVNLKVKAKNGNAIEGLNDVRFFLYSKPSMMSEPDLIQLLVSQSVAVAQLSGNQQYSNYFSSIKITRTK